MCDLVGMIVVDDDLFVSKFEAFKFENNKDNFSYEVMVCRAKSASLMNPTTNDEFGNVEIVNENMYAQISHHRVDENYVDEICGLFFEKRTNCGNMECAMFDKQLKVEANVVATSYEAIVGISHETMHDLVVIDD